MLQTITTMGSLLLSGGMVGVICSSLARERMALRVALRGAEVFKGRPLPGRTHRISGPRAAQIIRMSQPPRSQRAAA